jgi:hypothetical protein
VVYVAARDPALVAAALLAAAAAVPADFIAYIPAAVLQPSPAGGEGGGTFAGRATDEFLVVGKRLAGAADSESAAGA